MRSLSSDGPTGSPEGGPAESGSLVVAETDAGGRLDAVLARLGGLVSREMARRLIDGEQVWLNGKPARPAARLKAGDRVDWRVPPPRPDMLAPEAVPLAILYEDEHLVVLDKPAGVAVHPSPGHATGTLVHFLLAHCGPLSSVGGRQRPGIVHRLDKDTSGVMVAAKTDLAHQGLARQFHSHTIRREYLALAIGKPGAAQGKIDQPLDRDPENRLRRKAGGRGVRAVTHWRVVERLGPFTLLALRLETGRTHQIRAHLAFMDWPVAGDPVYGKGRHRGVGLPPQLVEAVDKLARQALHAHTLGFTHPATGQPLDFSAPLPPDMAALLAAVRAQFPPTGSKGP